MSLCVLVKCLAQGDPKPGCSPSVPTAKQTDNIQWVQFIAFKTIRKTEVSSSRASFYHFVVTGEFVLPE